MHKQCWCYVRLVTAVHTCAWLVLCICEQYWSVCAWSVQHLHLPALCMVHVHGWAAQCGAVGSGTASGLAALHSLIPCFFGSAVQRAVPPREVPAGGVLLPL